jgi:hypothetical protein
MEGESNRKKKHIDAESSDVEHDDRSILQSVRIRRDSVLVDTSHWKFMESELRFVLLSGTILWLIHIVSLAI